MKAVDQIIISLVMTPTQHRADTLWVTHLARLVT